MNGYTKQELEKCSFLSGLFGGKPVANAWKEINNILADADSATELSADQVKKALKNWGVKLSDENLQDRSAIYRKTADYVYTEAITADDSLFVQTKHLASVLELPEHLIGLANKGAKTAAYFNRCKKILNGEEKLTINEINQLFGYDYEDGLSIRKQVFQANFSLDFENMTKERRFSPEQEQHYRQQCEALDIPYEFKGNINNALAQYRNLWEAENAELAGVEVEGLPLREGEICRAHANSGICKKQMIEREDNLLEMSRKFNIDEVVSFKGAKLEQPKITEEAIAVQDVGYFFITDQRIIYASEKMYDEEELSNIESVDTDGVNLITYNTSTRGPLYFRYPGEAAEVLLIIVKRLLAKNSK